MKLLIVLFLFLISLNSFCQYQSIESTLKRDYVEKSIWYDNDLFYYNINKYDFEFNNSDLNPEICGNLAYFDFSTKSIVKTPIYSKSDSISEIVSIIKDNYDVMYTFRQFRTSSADTSPSYFLEKRSDDLSEVVESNQIFISEDIFVINAFFDQNDILRLKGLQVSPVFRGVYYEIDMNNLTFNFFTPPSFDKYQFHSINDSLNISYSEISEEIVYFKKDTFEIVDSVALISLVGNINSKSRILHNELFLNGKVNGSTWQEPVRHILYKHKLNSDTAIVVFVDSTEVEDAQVSTNSIDLIDTNFIYSSSHFGGCTILSGYNCQATIKIYCNNSAGDLKWTKSIGGDGNNKLCNLYATPDSGLFVLFYRFVEEDSLRKGDMYWVKYDKFGNEEPDYLNEFYLSKPEVEKPFSDINVFPNPTTSILNFEGIPSNQPSQIKIYNTVGQLVYHSLISDSEIDISGLSHGTYFYQIQSSKGLLKTGKLIKL